jgi:membrane protein YdbS with pleckstrin-like domain
VKDGCVVDAFAAPGLAWQAPSRRLLGLRRLQIRTTSALVLAACVVLVIFASLAGVIVLAVALAGFVTAEVIALRRYAAWGYSERAEDLLVRRGVMVQRLSVVPYGRMQFVDVVAGPLERRFGLATVRLHTAAAASDARVPGLPADEAERLRDRLAMLGESRAAGL